MTNLKRLAFRLAGLAASYVVACLVGALIGLAVSLFTCPDTGAAVANVAAVLVFALIA